MKQFTQRIMEDGRTFNGADGRGELCAVPIFDSDGRILSLELGGTTSDPRGALTLLARFSPKCEGMSREEWKRGVIPKKHWHAVIGADPDRLATRGHARSFAVPDCSIRLVPLFGAHDRGLYGFNLIGFTGGQDELVRKLVRAFTHECEGMTPEEWSDGPGANRLWLQAVREAGHTPGSERAKEPVPAESEVYFRGTYELVEQEHESVLENAPRWVVRLCRDHTDPTIFNAFLRDVTPGCEVEIEVKLRVIRPDENGDPDGLGSLTD